MNRHDKRVEIADILERELFEIKDNMLLEEIETWDSVAVLSFISVMNDKFNKFPSANEIRSLKTIGDLMDAMN